MQHVLSLFDIDSQQLRLILATASHLKARLKKGDRPAVLQRIVLGLLFEKQSLRTRVSFETGMAQLGGSSLFLGEDVGWGKREAASDFTQVLGQFVDIVVCRAKSHSSVQQQRSQSIDPNEELREKRSVYKRQRKMRYRKAGMKNQNPQMTYSKKKYGSVT